MIKVPYSAQRDFFFFFFFLDFFFGKDSPQTPQRGIKTQKRQLI